MSIVNKTNPIKQLVSLLMLLTLIFPLSAQAGTIVTENNPYQPEEPQIGETDASSDMLVGKVKNLYV